MIRMDEQPGRLAPALSLTTSGPRSPDPLMGSTVADRMRSGPSAGSPAPWYRAVSSVIALGVMSVVALGIVVSAVLVVSREQVGPTGAVVPTIPITTTPPPVAPSTTLSSPTPTQAPSRVPSSTPPPVIITTTAQPSTTAPPPPPPPTSATRRPSTPAPPSSAHPTSHRPFPQETTDFPGPPGTNG
jgi:hypothetical protein